MWLYCTISELLFCFNYVKNMYLQNGWLAKNVGSNNITVLATNVEHWFMLPTITGILYAFLCLILLNRKLESQENLTDCYLLLIKTKLQC